MSLFSVLFVCFLFALCYFLRFHQVLIFYLLALYFPLFSSYFFSRFFSFTCYTLFFALSFHLFVFYANFSLCPLSQFQVFEFTRSFVHLEMLCNYETCRKYHLSCDAISSWLIVIALSLAICGTVNELTSYRFYARFCRMFQRFIGDAMMYKNRRPNEQPEARQMAFPNVNTRL